MLTALIIIGIWLFCGLWAEISGIIYYHEFNGWGNALIIVALGFISLLVVNVELLEDALTNSEDKDI